MLNTILIVLIGVFFCIMYAEHVIHNRVIKDLDFYYSSKQETYTRKLSMRFSFYFILLFLFAIGLHFFS